MILPVVSIITPTFNSIKFVSQTIESVQAQSFSDWELLIADDCSNDMTRDILREWELKDNRIKIIYLDVNSGAAVARNAALSIAQGRYIAFLDSDDLWLPCKLSEQINFMELNNIDFCYATYDKIDENGSIVGSVGVPEKVGYTDLLKVCSIGCLTAMYNAEKMGKIPMPLIRKRQDLALWLRLLKKTPYAYGIPKVLARYRVRNDSISANKASAATYTWKVYREIEGMSFLLSSYYFVQYAVNGILRNKFPRLARFLGVLL